MSDSRDLEQAVNLKRKGGKYDINSRQLLASLYILTIVSTRAVLTISLRSDGSAVAA